MRTEGTGRSSQGRGLVTPGSRDAARGDFLCFPDGRSRPMRCLTSVHAVGLHQTSPRSSPTMAEAPGACPDPLRGHLEGVRRALAQELCGSREPPVRQARAPDERLAHGRPHRPHAARGPQTVRETRHGRLEPLKRSYVPQSMDERLITMWGKRITDVAKTYVHNLTRPANAPARFERAAVNDSVNASALPDFQRFLEQEGEAFLERVDAWLTAHEARADASDNPHGVVRLGAGLYHIQD